MKVCAVEECDRQSRALKMCDMHFKANIRDAKRRSITCVGCGKLAQVRLDTSTYCSKSCASLNTPRGVRSTPLTRAIRDGDHEATLAAIRDICTITPNGCWEWPRSRSSDGYPKASFKGRGYMVHRLALESKLGQKLGAQQAHHTCANPPCCNPDHIQPTTQRDNIAEMHSRVSMIRRIRELEEAIQEMNPNHPVLGHVPIVA